MKIKGAGGTKDFAQRTIRFIDAIKDKYDFASLNTHHVPFVELQKAMDIARHEKKTAFKVMLTF